MIVKKITKDINHYHIIEIVIHTKMKIITKKYMNK